MFQTSVLASGSKGNSILVRSAETAILVDAGLAGKTIFAALESLRIPKESIKAILVSHEHSDHSKGAGIIARALKIPIYMNEGTYEGCAEKLGKLPQAPIFFETGSTFEIRDLVVHSFTSSHDAIESCNFTIRKGEDEERKLGVATDLGYATRLTVNRLKGCTTLVLESNHDEEMLLNGSYDWALKQRVKSSVGHLSNAQAVDLVKQIMHHNLDNLILAHLSEENNCPELAYRVMNDYLSTLKRELNLLVAGQYKHTPLINI